MNITTETRRESYIDKQQKIINKKEKTRIKNFKIGDKVRIINKVSFCENRIGIIINDDGTDCFNYRVKFNNKLLCLFSKEDLELFK